VFGAAPVGFAYPFGDCNREVAAIVRNAGFDWACTTREEAVSVDCDRYLLPRLAVRDVSGQQLLRRMSELAPAGRSGPLSLLRA
jgi:hypothetical protein